MPTIIETFVNEAGDTINVYESGAHYNDTKKHLVKAPERAMITKENAWKFKEQLAEKKREAIIRGAGRALEKVQPGEWSLPNAADVAEALAEAITMKALNPDNPKQVDAARFIMQEAGISESQTKSSEEAQQFAGDPAVRELVALMRQALADRQADVIDAAAADVPSIEDTTTRHE